MSRPGSGSAKAPEPPAVMPCCTASTSMPIRCISSSKAYAQRGVRLRYNYRCARCHAARTRTSRSMIAQLHIAAEAAAALEIDTGGCARHARMPPGQLRVLCSCSSCCLWSCRVRYTLTSVVSAASRCEVSHRHRGQAGRTELRSPMAARRPRRPSRPPCRAPPRTRPSGFRGLLFLAAAAFVSKCLPKRVRGY